MLIRMRFKELFTLLDVLKCSVKIEIKDSLYTTKHAIALTVAFLIISYKYIVYKMIASSKHLRLSLVIVAIEDTLVHSTLTSFLYISVFMTMKSRIFNRCI